MLRKADQQNKSLSEELKKAYLGTSQVTKLEEERLTSSSLKM